MRISICSPININKSLITLLTISLLANHVLAHTTFIDWFQDGCQVVTFYGELRVGVSSSDCLLAEFTTSLFHMLIQKILLIYLRIRTETFVKFDSDTGIPVADVPWTGGTFQGSDGNKTCPGDNYRGSRTISCRQASVEFLLPGKDYHIRPSNTTWVEHPACDFYALGSFQVQTVNSVNDITDPEIIVCPPASETTLTSCPNGEISNLIPSFTESMVAKDCSTLTRNQYPLAGSSVTVSEVQT
eukprot:scaffold28271_cov60-Attheya_sp.AAC.1